MRWIHMKIWESPVCTKLLAFFAKRSANPFFTQMNAKIVNNSYAKMILAKQNRRVGQLWKGYSILNMGKFYFFVIMLSYLAWSLSYMIHHSKEFWREINFGENTEKLSPVLVTTIHATVLILECVRKNLIPPWFLSWKIFLNNGKHMSLFRRSLLSLFSKIWPCKAKNPNLRPCFSNFRSAYWRI